MLQWGLGWDYRRETPLFQHLTISLLCVHKGECEEKVKTPLH